MDKDALTREEGKTQPPSEVDFSWKEGVHLGYRHGDIVKLEFGGRLQVDGGHIAANQALQSSFPTLHGWNTILRSADVSLVVTFYQTIEAKIEYDFADQNGVGIRPQFQDVWIAAKRRIPVLGYITAGNMKEPFSLERLTGTADITFMERSLPTVAFSPAYNLGLKLNDTALNERITWAVGGFWNTQGLNNAYGGGDPEDQFSTANGYSVSARITGLPWYEEGGRRLLHLGVSYNFRARNANQEGAEEKFSTRPESCLTKDKLVDTGNIAATRTNVINGELAWVWGPASLQAEYYRGSLNAEGRPGFWGAYVQASYCLTGEHRPYRTSDGVFTGITARRSLNPSQGAWGAWEMAARYSYVDLNSGGVHGGKEGNLTLGLNWYPCSNVQFMFNYLRAYVTNSPAVSDGRASIYQGRFQIGF